MPRRLLRPRLSPAVAPSRCRCFDNRPQCGVRLKRVGEAVLFYPLDIGFDESVKQRLMDIDPFDPAAGLAGIEKSAIDRFSTALSKLASSLT